MDSDTVPMENITGRIAVMRQQRVLLDADLAALYGVSVKRLNEQVKRNRARFPEDFMFRLTRTEYENLRSQNATSSWGGKRHLRAKSGTPPCPLKGPMTPRTIAGIAASR